MILIPLFIPRNLPKIQNVFSEAFVSGKTNKLNLQWFEGTEDMSQL
jgi:hypothetical protein